MTRAELIEALKSAKGPDRGLDYMVHTFIEGGIGIGMYGDHPHYTSSLDAAISLVEREMADARPMIIQNPDGTWSSTLLFLNPSEAIPYCAENYATPAIALIIALLESEQTVTITPGEK